MTLTLTPDTEARLRSLAARRGQAPEAIVEALVQYASTEEERELQEAAAGIRAGLEDFAAGRWTALEELEAESRTARQSVSEKAS